ncbi:MAG TPA: hypothetical protein VNZ50_01590 [Hyphomicrobiaceae bacterium]|jgi:hypothetical protein|nr:hypothetical protein [Hyphomicrobiaceae bacterium]
MTKSISLLSALAIAALVSGISGGAVTAAATRTQQDQQNPQQAHQRKAIHHGAEHSSSCGVFMYWHEGKCVDARGQHRQPWTSSVF